MSSRIIPILPEDGPAAFIQDTSIQLFARLAATSMIIYDTRKFNCSLCANVRRLISYISNYSGWRGKSNIIAHGSLPDIHRCSEWSIKIYFFWVCTYVHSVDSTRIKILAQQPKLSRINIVYFFVSNWIRKFYLPFIWQCLHTRIVTSLSWPHVSISSVSFHLDYVSYQLSTNLQGYSLPNWHPYPM